MEKNPTYTEEQISLGAKSILAVLMNTIVVPFVANLIATDNLYGANELSSVVFFNALTSAFLTPLLKLVNPTFVMAKIARWWYNKPRQRLYLTQKQLNKINEEIKFEIGAEYV